MYYLRAGSRRSFKENDRMIPSRGLSRGEQNSGWGAERAGIHGNVEHPGEEQYLETKSAPEHNFFQIRRSFAVHGSCWLSPCKGPTMGRIVQDLLTPIRPARCRLLQFSVCLGGRTITLSKMRWGLPAGSPDLNGGGITQPSKVQPESPCPQIPYRLARSCSLMVARSESICEKDIAE